MNKLITGLVTGLVFCNILGFAQQPVLSITPGDNQVEAGEEFTVDVNAVSGFSDILSMQFPVTWDNSVIEFVAFSNVNGTDVPGLNDQSFGANPGNLSFLWFDNSLSGVNIPNNTRLFSITFRAVADGTTNVAIDPSAPPGVEIVNTAEQTLSFDAQNATVTIGDGQGGGDPGEGDGVIDFVLTGNVVNIGDDFCVSVTVDDFEDIVGAQFSINYDPDLINFTGIQNINLDGLLITDFGSPTSTPPSQEGIVTMTWTSPGILPVSVEDGTALFDICFTAVSNGSGTVALTGTPTSIEVINASEQVVNTSSTPGDITVQGSGGGGSEEFTLRFDDRTINAGDDFCIQLLADNFENIVGMQFSINYDPTRLQFNNVQNFNIPALNEGAFGNPSDGAVTVVWTEPGLNPVTLPNGSVMFELCFTATGTGTSFIEVTNNPTSVEFTNADEMVLTPQLQSGTISIQGSGNGLNGMGFGISDEAANSDDEVCVDVFVNDFDEIVGAQFSINYNESQLEFLNVSGINLAGLSEQNFGQPSPGTITMQWLDPAAQGITVADNTVIFQLCFRTIAPNGTNVPISFSGIPTSIEVIQAPQNIIDPDLRNGSISIERVSSISITSSTITNVACTGESTGAIDIAVEGGSGNYTYQWNYQGQTTEDLASIPAGSYTVTITDPETNSELVETFVVSEPGSAITISDQQITNAACFGESTGAIALTVNGGTGNLTFNWGSGLPQTEDLDNLPSGIYNVTITDDNNCTFESDPFVINQPASGLSASGNVTNTLCAGQTTGAIAVTVNGGTAPYQYDWQEPLPDGTPNQNSLDMGEYFLTITDNNGCTLATSFNVGQDEGVSITSIELTPIDGGDDGAIDLEVSGGTGNYTYAWTGPNGFTADQQDLNALDQPGEYCVTVSDQAGCIAQSCVQVSLRMEFGQVNTTPSCFGEATGSIVPNISGGVQPYIYNWSNGSSSPSLQNVPAGNYSLTVTDDTGNNISGNFNLGSYDEIVVNAQVTPVTGDPGNTNGAISHNVVGGNENFTFNWNSGATTPALDNLGEGTYCVTITASTGCTYDSCYTIEFTSIPLGFEAIPTSVTCPGDTDGALRLEVAGGSAPYTVTIGNGMPQQLQNGILELSDLPGGEISFIITDASGASIPGTVEIPEPDPLALDTVIVVHDTEAPGCQGSISLSVSGGSGSYSVRWNSPNSGFEIINLCEGNFIPTVGDSEGCEAVFPPIRVTEFGFGADVTNTSCPADINGAIDLQINGGTRPFTYEWRNEQGEIISTDSVLTNVPTGDYEVTVFEQSGNEITKSFSVGSNSQLSARIEILSDFNGFGVSCAEASDGIVEATAINGGGNYLYEWETADGTLVSTMSRLEGAAAGDYILTVIDQEAGCTFEMEVVIDAPPAIEITGAVTDIACFGQSNGQVAVNAIGGVSNTFIYSWNNGSTGRFLANLPAGEYTVTATDNNGCEGINTFPVIAPEPITVRVETEPATDICNGSATAVVTGGTPPYSFNWNVQSAPDAAQISDLCPGDYAVMVTDSRGCNSNSGLVSGTVLDRRFPCMEVRSVITPNGDGLNEEFLINCIEEFADNRLEIYNRWGQLVFAMDNYDNNWRGTTENGEDLPEGPYYYVLQYRDMEGNTQEQKGSITLLKE